MVDRLRSELEKNPNFLIDEVQSMILNNESRVHIKMIAEKNYEEKQKELEEDLLKSHLDKMNKKQKIECLDIELDLEMEQSAAPDMSCLPTLHKSDIPKEKENLFP